MRDVAPYAAICEVKINMICSNFAKHTTCDVLNSWQRPKRGQIYGQRIILPTTLVAAVPVHTNNIREALTYAAYHQYMANRSKAEGAVH